MEESIDSSDTNPFRYCGEYYDIEIGQIYLRARYYDPTIGRFTQQDTHWTPENMIYGDYNINIPDVSAIMQSNNLYVYCRNNPVNRIDSTGNYDRDAAVAYALSWYDERNPEYYSYSQDCANFVSQSLFAGGIKKKSSWHMYRGELNWQKARDPRGLYNNQYWYDWDVTLSWSRAQDQFNYFSDPSNGYIWSDVLTISSPSEVRTAAYDWGIQKGDLMYFYNSSEGAYHAVWTIVNKKDTKRERLRRNHLLKSQFFFVGSQVSI